MAYCRKKHDVIHKLGSTPHFAANNRLVQRLQSNVCSCRVRLHVAVQFSIIRGIRLVGHMFSPKIAIPLWGSSSLGNALFHVLSSLIIPNGISIGLSVFVRIPNAVLYNALSMGKKTPKIDPSFLGFHHPAGGKPSRGYRQHA